MPSNRQKTLGFVKKFGKFIRVRGKGLIRPNTSLDERFRRMTLSGTGAPAHKKIDGGTVRQHNRPYQLKDSATVPPKPARHFAPIVFKM